MNAAAVLEDLLDRSAQWRRRLRLNSKAPAALIGDLNGHILASSLEDVERTERFAAAVRGLLAEADGVDEDRRVIDAEAETSDGTVFVVRDDRHFVGATTAAHAEPKLVLFDLRNCLEMLAGPVAARDAARNDGAQDLP
jgi:hypothetical protein